MSRKILLAVLMLAPLALAQFLAAQDRGGKSGRIDVDQLDAVLLAEGGDHLVGFVLAHHPVIDEDTGEAVADRAMDEQRGCRRVDPA